MKKPTIIIAAACATIICAAAFAFGSAGKEVIERAARNAAASGKVDGKKASEAAEEASHEAESGVQQARGEQAPGSGSGSAARAGDAAGVGEIASANAEAQ